jgi:hypothetical protein
LAALPSIVALATALACAGCATEESRLRQHQEKLESLGATTSAVAAAWLAGSVSAIYARTALEQTFALVEQERTAVASGPEALLNPKAAGLAQAAEALGRRVALLISDVDHRDSAAVRQHLVALPVAPQEAK